MGSKNLKALAVHATTKVPPAHPAAVLAYNALSTLPTRNFQEATFKQAPRLAPGEFARARSVTKSSCASCSIGCEHLYRSKGGKGVRLEYQNVSALGARCGAFDPEIVLSASDRCDELGIDTISAGGTIAWAMECAERGLLDAPWLRFGDGESLLRALAGIGSGEGLGPLLALGSRRAAAEVGQGSLATTGPAPMRPTCRESSIGSTVAKRTCAARSRPRTVPPSWTR